MQLAPYVLPHLIDRPLTMIRFSDGINGNKFYSKNKPELTPEWISDVDVAHENNTIRYILANRSGNIGLGSKLSRSSDRCGSLGLHLAKVDDGNFSCMSKVGTDYDQEMMKEIFAKLKELKKVKKDYQR